MLRNFITATRTLTILPMPGREADNPLNALYFFPLVGLIIAAFVELSAWVLADYCAWQAGAAFVGVALMVFLTRALHLDGLSDVVDAFFGAATRERRLEIMKDPHIGAFGAAAVVLSLLCKYVALERLCAAGHWSWIILPIVLSRTVMVLAAVSLPYARTEGGKAQRFVSGAKSRHFWVAGALSMIICLIYTGGMGLIAFAAAMLLGLIDVWWMKKAFGGVTGDLLGFTGEKTECALYFLLALISFVV